MVYDILPCPPSPVPKEHIREEGRVNKGRCDRASATAADMKSDICLVAGGHELAGERRFGDEELKFAAFCDPVFDRRFRQK